MIYATYNAATGAFISVTDAMPTPSPANCTRAISIDSVTVESWDTSTLRFAEERQPVAGRRMTRLAFAERLGDAAFEALLSMSKQSIEVETMVKLIEWAQPDPDGTSIDLDDPRFQKLYDLEPALVQSGVVSAGWAAEVLA